MCKRCILLFSIECTIYYIICARGVYYSGIECVNLGFHVYLIVLSMSWPVYQVELDWLLFALVLPRFGATSKLHQYLVAQRLSS